jgi:hypothetical protein
MSKFIDAYSSEYFDMALMAKATLEYTKSSADFNEVLEMFCRVSAVSTCFPQKLIKLAQNQRYHSHGRMA